MIKPSDIGITFYQDRTFPEKTNVRGGVAITSDSIISHDRDWSEEEAARRAKLEIWRKIYGDVCDKICDARSVILSSCRRSEQWSLVDDKFRELLLMLELRDDRDKEFVQVPATEFFQQAGEQMVEERKQSAKEQMIDELGEDLTKEDFKKRVQALFEHARLYGLDVPSDDHMAYSAWRKGRWPTLLLSTLLQSIGYEKTANAIRKL